MNILWKEVKVMPRGDGTGPMGMGPMTGRGAGFCAGLSAPRMHGRAMQRSGMTSPGYMNPAVGCGMSFGRGRGFRRMFHLTGMPGWARSGYPVYGGAYAPAVDEKEFLGNQAEFLENQLQQVKKRLKTLSGEAE